MITWQSYLWQGLQRAWGRIEHPGVLLPRSRLGCSQPNQPPQLLPHQLSQRVAALPILQLQVCMHGRRNEQYKVHFGSAHLVWKIFFSSSAHEVLWLQPLFCLAHNQIIFRGNPILIQKLHLNILWLTSFPYPHSKGRALHGLQSLSDLNITFHLYIFQLPKLHLVWKKRTAKKQGCLTVLYSLNNHKQFLREVLQAQF